MEMIKTAVELLFVLLILTGALLSAVSSVGLIRLPDVYLRSHAVAKALRLVYCVCSAGRFSTLLFSRLRQCKAAAGDCLRIYDFTVVSPPDRPGGLPLRYSAVEPPYPG